MRRIRFGFLFLAFTGAFFLVGAKLYRLQIERGNAYLARAESQNRLAGLLEPERGTIYFTNRDGDAIPAAVNKEYPVVFAVPEEIQHPDEAAGTVAGLLGLDHGEVARKLKKQKDSYELLKLKATTEEASRIEAAGIKGIYVDTKKSRFYPMGPLGAHILGFVGLSQEDEVIQGRYGVEAAFEDRLRGESGEVRGDRIIDPVRGRDVHLTIDRSVQARAEEILMGLIEKYQASGGTVIVQEPKTGKIRAFANMPTFDPNEYFKYPIASYLNPGVQAIYEPGSIMKVVTLAAGFDGGSVTRETTFTDTGSLTLNGKTIANWDRKAYGTVSMAQVISHSINTGAAFVERKIGHDAFRAYLSRFGFDALTGIALPGEVRGSLRSLVENPRDINFATAAFGQGVAVTPIALAGAISALANGGLLMKPLILEDESPVLMRRVVSESAARTITEMMVASVKENTLAHIPNFTVAGKTGTAQIPNPRGGGYLEEFIHGYAGFAPGLTDHPRRFMILFKLDKPKGVTLSGATVVPAFRELAEFLRDYYRIPPDALEGREDASL